MNGWRIDLFLFLCSVTELFIKAHGEENETELTRNGYNTEDERRKIITAQFECYQKIMEDTGAKREGPVCNRTWDGWMCWEDTEPGFTAHQHCPDYFHDFDTTELVTKICSEDGHWFEHPDSNRVWTNYTLCKKQYVEDSKKTINMFYLALIGDGLSLVSLFISLGIFFHFKSLSCQRITLHKNLFFSFVLNSVLTIITLTAVASNKELMQQYLASCKLSQFIHLYVFCCTYFWMLCEGIYLHTLIVVAVFAEKQHLMWYYLLGWGFPLIPSSIHAVARSYYYNDDCWISSDTSLLYIIHGPICAALLVNLFFLLNIMRVLITKLKVTHQAESNLYMKAVRATLILIPLLGIQNILLPYKFEGRMASEIYEYVMLILMHYKGLLVATIYCFFNGEVQGVLKRHWNQYRAQFGSSFTHSDALRSASYTVSSMTSSITEVQGCYSIDGHTDYLNGKGCHDTETTILR